MSFFSGEAIEPLEVGDTLLLPLFLSSSCEHGQGVVLSRVVVV